MKKVQIFSIEKNKLSEVFENFQKYLLDMLIEKDITYKSILAIEEIYNILDKEKSADVGVRAKNDKLRFILYDNGDNIKKCSR